MEHVLSCSTVCGTGASGVCTKIAQQAKSTMRSMVCRGSRSCGRGSARTPGRNPAVSSSSNSKITASLAALVLCLRGARCAASPALSVFCARRPSCVTPAATLSQLWWAATDRAIATLCCSCRHHERRRRCLRRQAAPCSPCSNVSTTWAQQNGDTKETRTPSEPGLLLLCLLLLWLFLSGVNEGHSVYPQMPTSATPATEANSHGLITCVMTPYSQPERRRAALFPKPPPRKPTALQSCTSTVESPIFCTVWHCA